MFDRKTVFIVGAGGSRELGLPMGEDLKSLVADKVRFQQTDISTWGGDRKILDALFLKARACGERDLSKWGPAGAAIATAMPQAISIDNFLHTHASNTEIVDVGKLGIAASILDAERRSKIYLDRQRNELLDFKAVGPSWHSTFCKMLLENVQMGNAGVLDEMFQNVSFITFNYDRCIEHYLVQALRNYLLIDATSAQLAVSKLKIIHPYGQVGKLPWQDPAFPVPFGAELEGAGLLAVASQIRTFTERVEDDVRMADMRTIVQEAALVVFLGFSYGSMNLQLLSFPEPRPDYVGPDVLGTSLGLSASNTGALSSTLELVFNSGQTARLEHLTCDQLLQDYWIRILG